RHGEVFVNVLDEDYSQDDGPYRDLETMKVHAVRVAQDIGYEILRLMGQLLVGRGQSLAFAPSVREVVPCLLQFFPLRIVLSKSINLVFESGDLSIQVLLALLGGIDRPALVVRRAFQFIDGDRAQDRPGPDSQQDEGRAVYRCSKVAGDDSDK